MFIIETLIIFAIGCLLHFTYEWSHHSSVVGIFSAVNESTWEHIKIGLTGFLICSFADAYFFIDNPNYIIAKFLGLLAYIIVLLVTFYGYKFFTKKVYLIVDIICFFLSCLAGVFTFKYLMNVQIFSILFNIISLLGIFIVAVCYFTFTYMPRHNFLFKDPITGKYGVEGHKCFKH